MYPDKMLTRHFFTPSVRNKVLANRNLRKKESFAELFDNITTNTGSPMLEFLPLIRRQVCRYCNLWLWFIFVGRYSYVCSFVSVHP